MALGFAFCLNDQGRSSIAPCSQCWFVVASPFVRCLLACQLNALRGYSPSQPSHTFFVALRIEIVKFSSWTSSYSLPLFFFFSFLWICWDGFDFKSLFFGLITGTHLPISPCIVGVWQYSIVGLCWGLKTLDLKEDSSEQKAIKK